MNVVMFHLKIQVYSSRRLFQNLIVQCCRQCLPIWNNWKVTVVVLYDLQIIHSPYQIQVTKMILLLVLPICFKSQEVINRICYLIICLNRIIYVQNEKKNQKALPHIKFVVALISQSSWTLISCILISDQRAPSYSTGSYCTVQIQFLVLYTVVQHVLSGTVRSTLYVYVGVQYMYFCRYACDIIRKTLYVHRSRTHVRFFSNFRS